VETQGANTGVVVTSYTDAFKEQMSRKMIGPPGISAYALSKEVGVSSSQLCRWKNQLLDVLPGMRAEGTKVEKSPRAWTVKEKFRLMGQAQELDEGQLGELLRREGIHLEQLGEWRRLVELALSDSGERKLTASETKAMTKRVKELERELRRKDQALAEGAAMLFLEKKLRAMGWDQRHEDAEPDERTER
jgi:transposase